MFRVPSSSPPSTPDSRRASRNDDPSTTPAGPPPTGYTAQSFTPQGPPPASVFGSSFAGATNTFPHVRSAFAPTGQLNSPSLKAPLHTNPLSGFQSVNGRPAQRGFTMPDSSPPRSYIEDEEGDYSEDAEGEEMEQDNSEMDTDRSARSYTQSAMSSPRRNGFRSPRGLGALDSPRGLKRSRLGEVMDKSYYSPGNSKPTQPRDSAVPGIAKALAATMSKPTLVEPDELVLQSEQLLANLDESLKTRGGGDVDDLVSRTAAQLGSLWEKSVEKESKQGDIGPKNRKSGITNANYLASLLLQLHHPHAGQQNPSKSVLQPGHSTRFTNLVLRSNEGTPVPKALLDWLNTYHNPYPDDLDEVLQCKPNPTSSERFWDVIYATILRGNFTATLQLLETARFDEADTALEDGYEEPGYHGQQLRSVEHVVDQLIDLLKTCPAVRDGDWDVRDTEWTLFRNRVRGNLEDLEAYAEGDSADRSNANDSMAFQSSRFGRSKNDFSVSAMSRRAESKVPWTIYENLRCVYGQLQGSKPEVTLCAQDWLEATIFLTAWWDGEEEGALSGSLAASRRSLRQSQHTRQVDVSPLAAYQKQLLAAFASITDKPEDTAFGLNTVDTIQVGLACVLEGNVEGAVDIVRGWSVPVAAALVEIASAGGWLPEARPRSRGLMEGLDEDDLMVLSSGQERQHGDAKRDDVLISYANLLADRDAFSSQDGKLVREGWELACRVLSRLNSAETAQRKIGQLLAEVPLDDTDRVDKVLAVCADLGLSEQVQGISERYADILADSTQSYGSAIVYYARAHSVQKIKSTLDLLISMCLVQSAAYPPSSSLDKQLDSLINDQRHALSQLAKTDLQAAQLISTYFSGYATLRKFYQLRDEDVQAEPSFSHKREAAKALLAVIESAADSIRGGLYDPGVDAVVQVDALLALLGEALPLMNRSKPLLEPAQLIVLIRATEDLQTVSARVYSQTESLFAAAMSHYHGGTDVSAPRDLAKSLHKSISNLSGSSYGMVDSHGSIQSSYADVTRSRRAGGQDGIKRTWDWRAGIATVAGRNAKGEDVLRVLRAQVAKEMARAWTEGF